MTEKKTVDIQEATCALICTKCHSAVEVLRADEILGVKVENANGRLASLAQFAADHANCKALVNAMRHGDEMVPFSWTDSTV